MSICNNCDNLKLGEDGKFYCKEFGKLHRPSCNFKVVRCVNCGKLQKNSKHDICNNCYNAKLYPSDKATRVKRLLGDW